MTELPLTSATADRQRLDRFHKLLVVLRKVCPDKQDRECTSDPKVLKEVSRKQQRDSWSVYLNHLCWLLDYKTGGKTVTSIAVEQCAPGPRYWLACNRNTVEKVSAHLIRILERLKKFVKLPAQERQKLKTTMFVRAVAFSRPTIKNYINRLLGRFKDIKEPDDKIKSIHELFAAKATNHSKICQLAYNFRKTENMQYLKRLSAVNKTAKLIRHDIGRLSSWRRATIVLTRFAADYPGIVQNFEVKHLESRYSSRHPMDDQSIIMTVRDVLPDKSFNTMQAVLGMNAMLDCQKATTELSDEILIGRTSSCTHCEILVAEHFFTENLAFWGGRRSIGCSKPSCYCCDIYLKRHPGNFEERPCHGNVYDTWLPPSISSQSTEVLQPHVRLLLDNMMETMKKDIIAHFKEKNPNRRRTPDSTTAITSTDTLSVV